MFAAVMRSRVKALAVAVNAVSLGCSGNHQCEGQTLASGVEATGVGDFLTHLPRCMLNMPAATNAQTFKKAIPR